MNFKPAREALIKKTQHKIFIASAIVTWLVGFVKLLLHPKIRFILYKNWPKCANLRNLAPCEAGNPSRKCSLEADLKQRHVAPTNHDHRWLFLFFYKKCFWTRNKSIEKILTFCSLPSPDSDKFSLLTDSTRASWGLFELADIILSRTTR